jgi:hypothetical protein
VPGQCGERWPTPQWTGTPRQRLGAAYAGRGRQRRQPHEGDLSGGPISPHRRIAARRGKGQSVLAVGHSVLVAFYHMLTRHEPYRDLGADYFDDRQRDQVQRRLVHRLERLGYAVTLEPLTTTS